jgi:polyisoprenoid-binding protein YceI
MLSLIPMFVTACGPSTTQVGQTSAPTVAAPAATQPPTSAAKPTSVAAGQPTAATAAKPTTAAGQPTSATAAKPTESGASKPSTASADTVLLNLAADGSRARFRAREQLARLPAPSEAIGTTSEVSGAVGVGPNGVVADASKISVQLDSLTSDSGQRDRFIKQNTLQTQQFPSAEFLPKQASGLPWPLPTSGEMSFQLTGDLTIRGVTQPKTWEIKAQFAPNEVTGSGSTSITLEQFGMEKPRVASVLSIEDTIVLEIDFRAVP